MEHKNNKKTIRAWAMFDWANSAYNLVITSTIFPAYYTAITSNPENGDKVSFFGIEIINTVLSTYALATAYLVIAFLTPILTSVADFRGNKKIFMQLFTWIGALACCTLFFFNLSRLELGIICSAIAAIGYCGSFVFYNSYLPEIATPDQQDAVSAKGFSFGYVGSVLLQLICFVFVLAHPFGMSDQLAAQISFLLVGLWWLGFSIIPFTVLPKGSPNFIKLDKKVNNGFQELRRVWAEVKQMPVLKRYLTAFFFYSMGVQTIMLVATNFASKTLHMEQAQLIAIILIIQLVAIGGAWLMSRLSGVYGNVRVLIGVVALWAVVCVMAYFVTTANQFYVVAVIVGMVMGGIQSLSRSTYSKYLPENIPDTASYFSFYDVTEKLAIVAGLFGFGYIEALTGSMRNSTVFLALIFVVALFILGSLRRLEKKAAK